MATIGAIEGLCYLGVYLSTEKGLALGDFVPDQFAYFAQLHGFMPRIIGTLNKKAAASLLNQVLPPSTSAYIAEMYATCIAFPLVEDLSYRYPQDLLFKRIPLTIAQKKCPQYTEWIVSPSAQLLRILFFSMAFALAHSAAFNANFGGGLPQLFGALILSAQMEFYGDIRYPLLAHVIHNIISLIKISV